MYRLLRSYFARSQYWQQYDPFSTQKVSAFKSSAPAIRKLSDAVEPLIKKAEAASRRREDADASETQSLDQGLEVIFRELVQTSLWGNATDLSLLTHMTHADIQQLQAGGVGAEAQAKREHFILSGLGGIASAWNLLVEERGKGTGQVDIILDNSGFELYTDLLLADFLVTSGVAETVVFHPKDMPWFVSDVTPSDFLFTLEALQDADFFAKAMDDRSAGQPVRVSRSSSRQREMVADPRHFEGERRDMSPAGSRVLQMQTVPEEAAKDNQAYGSRTLQMSHNPEKGRAEEATDQVLSERGRPTVVPSLTGSRQLKLDRSYFQNARSRTVSPSRSYVMDSSSMMSFSSAMSNNDTGDGERRGRSAASSHTSATQRLATRWSNYLASGKFQLSMPLNTPLGGAPSLHATTQADFWTSYHNYPSLPLAAPHLFSSLSQSRLVLSKGDLNYRKWCSDARWDFTQPFVDVLGPVQGKLNLLVLRTNKADVCVGVPKDRLESVEKEDAEWRTDGKFAVIEFVQKKD